MKSSRVDEFRAMATRQHPQSTVFGTVEEVAARQAWLRKSQEISESTEYDL